MNGHCVVSEKNDSEICTSTAPTFWTHIGVLLKGGLD